MVGSQQSLYVYKVVADTGGAPCIWRGTLSLAICKPKIRHTARKGDLIFGFGGKTYGERLLYIAEVTEKPEVGDYYQAPRFAARPDCIYKDKNGVPERKPSARFHAETDERQKDVGMKFEKAFVLLSDDFRYFGVNGTDSYKQKFPSVKILIEELK
jgi:Nucleotide modification associated domain 2